MSDLSRVEQLLRNALGEDIYEVTPQSRVEVLLQQLNEYIEGMGGGSVEADIYKPYATDTASGAIASFTDGADDIPLKSLVVDINPVQDLHGYDSPWVGGSGKNLLDPTLLKDQLEWNIIDLQLKPNTQYVMSTDMGTSSAMLVYFTSDGTQGSGSRVSSSHPVVRTATSEGIIQVVQRRASGDDSFQNYHFQVEEGSTPTDWTPYENICPISGWTGMTVSRTGKNLFTYVPNKIYVPLSVTLDKSRATLVKKGITYSMSFDMQNATTWRICAVLFDLEGNRHFVNGEYPFGIVNPYLGPNASGQYYVFGGNYTFKSFVITPIDDFYVMFFFLLGDTSESTVMVNPMLEIGSTATSYEPYAGRSIPISWQTEAGTVYGGKLDVLSGVLTVEREMVILDGTESWSKPDNGFLTAKYKSDKSYPDAICSTYIVAKSYSGVNGTDKRIAITTGGVRLHDSQFANATALKTYLVENNVQLCYNLKNPIEIQLEPHEVKSLLGANNIFADTGDSAVEYRADTKLYIEKLTQPTEDDMVANSAITSGQFFMVGNSLYRALANIASGATITVGTNAQRVSLADALNLINT